MAFICTNKRSMITKFYMYYFRCIINSLSECLKFFFRYRVCVLQHGLYVSCFCVWLLSVQCLHWLSCTKPVGSSIWSAIVEGEASGGVYFAYIRFPLAIKCLYQSEKNSLLCQLGGKMHTNYHSKHWRCQICYKFLLS